MRMTDITSSLASRPSGSLHSAGSLLNPFVEFMFKVMQPIGSVSPWTIGAPSLDRQ